METAVLAIHCIIATFLIGTILLQSGKGADIGAAFGAGGSQTVFGPRGAATLLSKVTIGCAIIFLATSLTLTHFARQDAGSVLESVPASEQVPDTIPVPPLPPEAEPKANGEP